MPLRQTLDERQALGSGVESLEPIANHMVLDTLHGTTSSDHPLFVPRLHQARRDRREVEETTLSSSQSMTSTMSTSTSSISTSSTSSAASTTLTSFPQPFDAGLDNNFTSSSCPEFFSTFLNDAAFISCYPVSLLLQTSTAFFQDTKSFSITNQVLNFSCSVSSTACSSLMSSYANQLTLSSNCLDDYNAGNLVVQEAYNGFLAYQTVFDATCLRDGTLANNYCYANAVTNTSSPTSSWVYYLSVGVALPAASTPTCNQCLKKTMHQFAGYATNGTLPVSKVYPAAAQQINLVCGPGFVNAAVIVTSAAVGGRSFHDVYSWALTTVMVFSLVLLT